MWWLCCCCLGCWVDEFFFFLFIVLESGLTGFFLKNLKFVIVVLVLGVGRFGVWVVFVDSVLGLLVFFVWCVWVVSFSWVVRFDLGGRPSGPP